MVRRSASWVKDWLDRLGLWPYVFGAAFLVAGGLGGAAAVIYQYPLWAQVVIAIGAFLLLIGFFRDLAERLARRSRSSDGHPETSPVTSQIQIQHIDQFFNISAPGFDQLAQGSNTIIRTPFGVGPLFPASEIDGYITASAQIASGAGSAYNATVRVSHPESED